MGSRRMSSLKMTLPILALSLLLSITTQVHGKPLPKHLLIETEEQAKETSGSNEDYQSWWPNYQTQNHWNQNQFSNTKTNQNSGNSVTGNGNIIGTGNNIDNSRRTRNSGCIKWCFRH